jgi:long-subunit acyl-CoA synthetase (AMP-forming)
LLFGTVAASLGGRLRYVLVCDRDMDAEVRQFFEVAVAAAVLPVFGFPEAGGLVAMLTPSARALTARRTKAKRLSSGHNEIGGGMHGHPYSMSSEAGVPPQGGVGGADHGSLMNAATVDSAGFPLPCNELKLVPVEGDFASACSSGGGQMQEGAPYGELHIRGANTFEGYQGKAHLTEEAYSEGRWLKTGYICTCTAEGQLRVLGKRTSFLQPRRGLYVCAQRLETIYAHRCAMVHQIWCHCEVRHQLPLPLPPTPYPYPYPLPPTPYPYPLPPTPYPYPYP